MRDMSEQPVSPINESTGSDQQPPAGARGLRSRQEQTVPVFGTVSEIRYASTAESMQALLPP